MLSAGVIGTGEVGPLRTWLETLSRKSHQSTSIVTFPSLSALPQMVVCGSILCGSTEPGRRGGVKLGTECLQRHADQIPSDRIDYIQFDDIVASESQPAPHRAILVLANLSYRGGPALAECLASVMRHGDAGLRIGTHAARVAYSRQEIGLQTRHERATALPVVTDVRRAAFSPQRPAGIRVGISGELVERAALIVAHDAHALEVHEAVGSVSVKLLGIWIIGQPLVKQAGLRVIAPGHIGGRKCEHIELVRILLVGVTDRIRCDRIFRNLGAESRCRHHLGTESMRYDDDVLTALGPAEPDQAVLSCGAEARHGMLSLAACLHERADQALKREVLTARVIPGFGRFVANEPELLLALVHGYQIVGSAILQSEIGSIEPGPVLRKVGIERLRAGLIEDPPAIDEGDTIGPKEGRIGDLAESLRRNVVEITVWAIYDHRVAPSIIVADADRTRARQECADLCQSQCRKCCRRGRRCDRHQIADVADDGKSRRIVWQFPHATYRQIRYR